MLLQLVGRIFLGPALILRRPDSSSSYAESSGSGSGSLVQDGRTDKEQTNKPTQNMKIWKSENICTKDLVQQPHGQEMGIGWKAAQVCQGSMMIVLDDLFLELRLIGQNLLEMRNFKLSAWLCQLCHTMPHIVPTRMHYSLFTRVVKINRVNRVPPVLYCSIKRHESMAWVVRSGSHLCFIVFHVWVSKLTGPRHGQGSVNLFKQPPQHSSPKDRNLDAFAKQQADSSSCMQLRHRWVSEETQQAPTKPCPDHTSCLFCQASWRTKPKPWLLGDR